MRQAVRSRLCVNFVAAITVGALFAAPTTATPGVGGIDIQLPVGRTISGTITDDVGNPLSSATVGACADATGQCEFDETAVDGSYRISGLAPDVHRVSVSPPDASDLLFAYYTPSGPVSSSDDAAPIDVTPGDVAGIDLAMPVGFQIRGNVRDPDGNPIEGLEIIADGGGGVGTSDASGDYVIHAVRSGTYTMAVRNGGRLNFLSGPVIDGVVGDPNSEGTPITVESANLAGIDIVDSPGFRLSGNLASAPQPTEGGVTVGADGDPFGFSVSLDPAGNWIIPGLRPGQYKLFFQVDGPFGGSFLGYWRSDGTLTLDYDAATFVEIVDGDVAGIDASVPPAPSISGRVIGEDGSPLAHAFLYMCAGPSGCVIAFSAADGTFHLDRIASGSWALYAGARDHVSGYYGPNGFALTEQEATPITVARRDVTGITVVLPTGFEVSGRITKPGGEGVPDVQVGRSGGIDLGGGGVARTAADGTYRIAGITPGDYTISVGDLHGTGLVGGYYNANDPNGYGATFHEATPVSIAADPPALLSQDPGPGASVPASGLSVRVRFDRFVLNVNGTSFSLWDGTKRLQSTVTYDRATSTATLTPRGPLRHGRTYLVKLDGPIRDLLGLQFTATSWTFSTIP
jgi:hypothetical protein